MVRDRIARACRLRTRESYTVRGSGIGKPNGVTLALSRELDEALVERLQLGAFRQFMEFANAAY
jgi:hypothetical protein